MSHSSYIWRAAAALSSVFVAIALSTPAEANDSVFGGVGGALVPMEETQVQMREEEIVLSAHDTFNRWDVEAHYVFFNHASVPVTVQVGFPELVCWDDEESMCQRFRFQNLKTTVDGKTVSHRKGSLDEHEEWSSFIGTVWLFDVTFPPRKAVHVEHTYTTGSGINSMGSRFTTYVTRTGKTWAKRIERARFVMRVPPFAHALERIRGKGLETRPPKVAQDGRIELVAEAKNWEPTEDVSFNFTSEARVCTYGSVKPEQAQDCINELHALKGYPFKKPELRKTYYRQPGFEATSGGWTRKLSALQGFNRSWFTPFEARQLEQWTQLAKRELAENQSPDTNKPDEPSGISSEVPKTEGPQTEGPQTKDGTDDGSHTATDSNGTSAQPSATSESSAPTSHHADAPTGRTRPSEAKHEPADDARRDANAAESRSGCSIGSPARPKPAPGGPFLLLLGLVWRARERLGRRVSVR